jgi:hypothetical protein
MLLLLFLHGEVIKLLLKLILINEKINNWVVKIGCENRLLLYMQEPL